MSLSQKVFISTQVFENKIMCFLEMKEKLTDFEIRFLVRRGNAYSKLQKFYHAKSDFEEALKLDPKNEQLKKDLESINAALAKS